jgi:hypothetical protein
VAQFCEVVRAAPTPTPPQFFQNQVIYRHHSKSKWKNIAGYQILRENF